MLILCDNPEDKKAWLSKLKLAMEERKKGDAQGPPPSAMDQVRARVQRGRSGAVRRRCGSGGGARGSHREVALPRVSGSAAGRRARSCVRALTHD